MDALIRSFGSKFSQDYFDELNAEELQKREANKRAEEEWWRNTKGHVLDMYLQHFAGANNCDCGQPKDMTVRFISMTGKQHCTVSSRFSIHGRLS
jgi:hypothetical protein